MLDKLLLNNQLISNKKKVQQAKVNTINKLVQKIRNLKKLNEKKPDDKKIQKKLDKSTETLSCVKKIKNVELLKRALLNTKNPTAIITDGKSTPEQIADAMLFNNKIIAVIANNLKILLNLDDVNNPGWREEISELSKKQKKSLRTEKKQKIRQERKTRNELESKRNEWLEENVRKSVQDDENRSRTINKKEITDDGWEVEKLPKSINKVKQTNKKVEKKRKEKEPLEEKKETVEDKKSLDPFFITQNGDNYLSSVEIDRIQSNDNDKSNTTKNVSHFNTNRRRNENFKNGKLKSAKNFNSQKRNSNEDNIHPSWKAKQQFRSIQEFKGTKVVFDDAKSNNSVVKAADNSNSIGLHPSWAAKQKLKPSIKEFEGKKIVFDDN